LLSLFSPQLFELLKNSLRATVEFHGKDKDSFPDVRIIVAQGDEVTFWLLRFLSQPVV